MTKSSKRSRKKRNKTGRPPTTGIGTPTMVRMHKSHLQALDSWIQEQGDGISRPEAIRRIVARRLRISA